MPPSNKSDLRPEIAHVLFMDIVGYSKLSINEQTELVGKLNEIVRQTAEFRDAESAGKLVRLPTGDGMALIFFNTPEAPVRCAAEISRALKNEPMISLRMGIHSGPIHEVLDVNDRSNVAGAGIDNARRVMECGDGGHILLSKRAADDLMPYRQWRSHFQELGETKVKHGERISIFNFYTGEIGNPRMPAKLRERPASGRRNKTLAVAGAAVALLILAALLAFFAERRSTTPASSTLPPNKSIAVLPFENLSKDEENAFFAGGMQDEILSDLAKIADLKVISRTSVMKYKSGPERNLREIAKALGVAHVVEGSVQRAGGRVRVSAQLIDARSDTHLWADHYDRDVSDVFAIQSEIAQQIANQLRATLSPDEKARITVKPTENTAAYDDYLRAKDIIFNTDPDTDPLSDDRFAAAVRLLEEAVRKDSGFARAYSMLAQGNLFLYFFNDRHPVDRLRRAEAAKEQARKLEPDAPETHFAESYYYYYGTSEHEKALAELQLAARSLPNSAEIFNLRARIERRLGKWDEATEHFRRAIELDPRGKSGLREASIHLALIRDYAGAIKLADRGITDIPEAPVPFQMRKAQAAYASGDLQLCRAALAEIPAGLATGEIFVERFSCALAERDYAAAERLVNNHGNTPPGEINPPDSFFLGFLARAKGDNEKTLSHFREARAVLEAMINANRGQRVPGYLFWAVAQTYAALGQRDDALRAAAREVELAVDPLDRPGALIDQASIWALLGDKEHALNQLEPLTKIPNGVTFGNLRFDPMWDSLRGNPRFEKIVASLKPQ